MSAMEKQEEYKVIYNLIHNKYNKVVLTPKETASILGVTESFLKKDREQNNGIPYTRINGKERGKPLYSITAIAKTIVDNQVKIFN